MATLLGRRMTAGEQAVQARLRVSPVFRIKWLAQQFRAGPDSSLREVFAAAMALVELPIANDLHRQICICLLDLPGFVSYLGQPSQFSRRDLVEICRILMDVDPTVDMKLAKAVQYLNEQDSGPDIKAIIRLLGVLDGLSPGRRVTMSLIHLLSESGPQVASKAALFLGKRVQSQAFLKRQMESGDARVRANVVEGVWGVNTPYAQECLHAGLKDAHHRVAGNAIYGLFLLKDPSVANRVRQMLQHRDPAFRASAAWLIGKMGDSTLYAELMAALADPEIRVRASVTKALAQFPFPEDIRRAPEVPATAVTMSADMAALAGAVEKTEAVPQAASQPAPEPVPALVPQPKPWEAPVPREDSGIEIHLDGSSKLTRHFGG